MHTFLRCENEGENARASKPEPMIMMLNKVNKFDGEQWQLHPVVRYFARKLGKSSCNKPQIRYFKNHVIG
ncbi:MAG: hypothetical protein Q7J38_06470 [Gallionella sp.]|nr:hypothetical protein [Gallionella sp.]